MLRLIYNKNDLRYLFVLHDGQKMSVTRRGKTSSMYEILALEEHLNKIPDYQFLPSFSGIPRPVVFLQKTRIDDKVVYYCNSGLWKEIEDWCGANGVKYEGVDNNFKLTEFSMSLSEFQTYIDNWELNIDPRGYQVEAAWRILHYKQSLSQLATRAGKTLIAYIIFRYMLEHGAHNILMIVPSISLVRQGVEDMKEYKEFFQSETVWAKGEYCESSNLTIGTFQSLIKRCTRGKYGKKNSHYDPKFFEKFDVICVDECHKADCNSIKEILSQPFIKNIKIRFGFSGTLPDTGTLDSYAVQALLGPCIQDISSRELIDAGFLAEPDITQIRIRYRDDNDLTSKYIRYGEYLCSTFVKDKNGDRVKLPEPERDMTMIYEKRLPIALREAKTGLDPQSYREFLINLCKAQGSNLLNLEQMIAEHSQRKLDVIYQLLLERTENGIVFAHNEAYLTFLYEHFRGVFSDRPIYLIKGSVSSKKRDAIRQAMNEADTNAILFASYGCVGTGLTFKNIDYCIFAQSFKSKIINLQSIGRGLLLSENKTRFSVYDIIDCLPTKRLERHGKSKIEIYKRSNYKYSIKYI